MNKIKDTREGKQNQKKNPLVEKNSKDRNCPQKWAKTGAFILQQPAPAVRVRKDLVKDLI